MTENHGKTIRNITLAGMFLNLFLAGLKFAVGIAGRSQAVVADAVHSLSDLVTDFAVLVGVKFWEPPADDEHPYGHKKIESIVTFFIGLLLGYAGLQLMIGAVTSIPASGRKEPLWIAAAGPLFSIIGKEILFRWTIRTGKRVKSSAVIANAWHHRSDAISSIPVLIAVAASALFPELAFIDAVGAVIVSGFIFKVAWDIIKPAFYELTDRTLDRSLIREIDDTARKVKGVESVHKIRTRKSGSAVFVDMHVLVEGSLPVVEGHEICENVKMMIKKTSSGVVDVLIHLEPAGSPETE